MGERRGGTPWTFRFQIGKCTQRFNIRSGKGHCISNVVCITVVDAKLVQQNGRRWKSSRSRGSGSSELVHRSHLRRSGVSGSRCSGRLRNLPEHVSSLPHSCPPGGCREAGSRCRCSPSRRRQLKGAPPPVFSQNLPMTGFSFGPRRTPRAFLLFRRAGLLALFKR